MPLTWLWGSEIRGGRSSDVVKLFSVIFRQSTSQTSDRSKSSSLLICRHNISFTLPAGKPLLSCWNMKLLVPLLRSFAGIQHQINLLSPVLELVDVILICFQQTGPLNRGRVSATVSVNKSVVFWTWFWPPAGKNHTFATHSPCVQTKRVSPMAQLHRTSMYVYH